MLMLRVAKGAATSHAEIQASKLVTAKAENVSSLSLLQPQKPQPISHLYLQGKQRRKHKPLPVKYNQGMKWHPSQLQGEAQVQTSRPDFLGAVGLPLFVSHSGMQKHSSTLQLAADEVLPSASQSVSQGITSEPAISEEKQSLPSLHAEIQEEPWSRAVLARRLSPRTRAEAGVQTSHADMPLGNKWQMYRLRTEAQVQTSCQQLPVSNSKTSLLQDTDVSQALEQAASK